MAKPRRIADIEAIVSAPSATPFQSVDKGALGLGTRSQASSTSPAPDITRVNTHGGSDQRHVGVPLLRELADDQPAQLGIEIDTKSRGASVKHGGDFAERGCECSRPDQDAQPNELEMDRQIGTVELLPRDPVQPLSRGDTVGLIAVTVNRRSRTGGDLFQEQ